MKAKTNQRIEELRAARYNIDKELEVLEKMYAPRTAADVPAKEKIEVYDYFHALAINYVNDVEKGVDCEDFAQYLFEDVLTKCLGPNVFKDYVNKVRS